MNRQDARDILLRYRHHHAADAEDPQVADALAFAKTDAELSEWLEMHAARQFVLREKFRQIQVPEGLREQIISEHAASRRQSPRQQRLFTEAMAVVVVCVLAVVGWFAWHRPPANDRLELFQNQMVGVALRGYQMDFESADTGAIRAWLKDKSAPSEFTLPDGLQKNANPTGCAVAGWRTGKATMVCFRTGNPLPEGVKSDLWLFVAPADSVKDVPGSTPVISHINRLVTATWVKDGKIYLLGTEGDEAALRKFL
jgi:hypothetical protein